MVKASAEETGGTGPFKLQIKGSSFEMLVLYRWTGPSISADTTTNQLRRTLTSVGLKDLIDLFRGSHKPLHTDLSRKPLVLLI